MHKLMHAEVEVLPSGYRRATVYGAALIVRPDGSQSFSNVKDDSELYAVLNAALFAADRATR
jgi:hypothetical protein